MPLRVLCHIEEIHRQYEHQVQIMKIHIYALQKALPAREIK